MKTKQLHSISKSSYDKNNILTSR